MLIVSPEFKCSNEILTITAMLSGSSIPLIVRVSFVDYDARVVPNIWIRPNSQRREADAAKALLSVPDGDHLTLLNVYNNYVTSTNHFCAGGQKLKDLLADMYDKNWTWTNYLNARALSQAENVRAQLQRTMERFDVELVSIEDERKLHIYVRQALVCGFFMQVAHKEGEKGNYLTVKDNQVSLMHYFA